MLHAFLVVGNDPSLLFPPHLGGEGIFGIFDRCTLPAGVLVLVVKENMSEVLAIKVGEKRPFEDEGETETVSCSGHRMALLELSDNQLFSPPTVPPWLDRVSWKKSRRFWTREKVATTTTNHKVGQDGKINHAEMKGFPLRESCTRSESDSDESCASDDKTMKPCTKRLASRTKVMKCSNCGSHSLFPVDDEEEWSNGVLQDSTDSDISTYMPLKFWKILNSGEGRDSEKLFSLKELKEIVSEALSNKTRHLTYRYNAVLQEKLAEQFQSFSKFNEDYVARQLKERDRKSVV